MKLLIKILVLFFLFCLQRPAVSQVTAFLHIPPDAVSQALGGPNQAYSSGAADIFINPALLARHTAKQVQFSNIIDWKLIQYGSASFTMPVSPKDFVGIGLIGVNIPYIKEYDKNGMFLGEFNNYQAALIVGYARQFFPFTGGVSLKYTRMGFMGSTFENTGNGFGLDVGLSYTVHPMVDFGFVFQNSFNVRWKNNYRDESPRRMALAATVEPGVISDQFFRLLLGIDQMKDEPMKLNVGVEVTPLWNTMGLHAFSLRAGAGNVNLELREKNINFSALVEAEQAFTAGAGLALGNPESWGIEFDYCFKILKILDNQHSVTTKFWF